MFSQCTIGTFHRWKARKAEVLKAARYFEWSYCHIHTSSNHPRYLGRPHLLDYFLHPQIRCQTLTPKAWNPLCKSIISESSTGSRWSSQWSCAASYSTVGFLWPAYRLCIPKITQSPHLQYKRWFFYWSWERSCLSYLVPQHCLRHLQNWQLARTQTLTLQEALLK